MKINIFGSLLVGLVCAFPHTSKVIASNQLIPVKVSKEPTNYKPSGKDAFPVFEIDQTMVLCLENCKYRNRMVSMGIEAIMEGCQHQCDIEKARTMSKSNDPVKKEEGTRMLCDLADINTVPDLITLLKEDLQIRTGIWAEIIPALGNAGDDRAIPILSELVKLTDDDWLGREMAVVALGEIGSYQATKVLMHASWRADTRDAAIVALVKINDPRAASVLVSAIQPEEEQLTRDTATVGLIRLGTSAVPAILAEYELFSQESKQTQKRVILCEILGEIGDEQSKEILQQSLNDNDPAVKKCAEKYL